LIVVVLFSGYISFLVRIKSGLTQALPGCCKLEIKKK
jgi:hypothetical protein